MPEVRVGASLGNWRLDADLDAVVLASLRPLHERDGLERDALPQADDIDSADTVKPRDEFDVRIYQCRVCGNEFASIRWTFTRCPHCGSPAFMLVKRIIDSVKSLAQTEPHT